MRTLPAGLQAALLDPEARLFWLVEIATAPTTGSLQRIHDGLVDDVLASSLSDLSAFTVVSGTWGLVGGKIQCTAGDPGLLRYDGVADTTGLIVQALADPRAVGDPFWGVATNVDPSATPTTGQEWVVAKIVTKLGSTAPPGVERKIAILGTGLGPGLGGTILDQDLGIQQNHPVTIALPGPRTHGGEGYHHPGNPSPIGFGFMNSPPLIGIPNGRAGLWSSRTLSGGIPVGTWTFDANPTDFSRLSIYEDWSIRVIGLPAGWTAQMTGGSSPAFGQTWGGTAAGPNGESVVDGRGDMYPYSTVEVYDASGVFVASITPPGGVWGGDVYQFVPGSPTPILNITTARDDVSYLGKTWEASRAPSVGPGREIASIFDAIRETGDMRAQGVNLGFSAVDLDAIVNVLRNATWRGGICRIYLARWDEDVGEVGNAEADAIELFRGTFERGLELSEEATDFSKDATATVKTRVGSRFSEKEQASGIRTMTSVHQQYSPGDTFFDYVPIVKNRKVWWGRARPG